MNIMNHWITAHPFDPWGSKIGGIEQFIRALIRHAPPSVRHSIIGVSESPAARPLRQWLEIPFEGRTLRFFALLADPEPYRRARLPLTLRFTLRMRGHDWRREAGLAIYHRLEPLAAGPHLGPHRLLFIHGHPREIVGVAAEGRWKHLPWLYRIAESRALQRAEDVFVVSESGTKFLKETYPSRADRIHFQPAGYRDDRFFLSSNHETDLARVRLRERYTIDRTAHIVLFAGRLEPQKDPLLALETFALARARMPSLHLLVVGAGSLLDAFMQRRRALGLVQVVTYIGPLSPPDLADGMRGCDALLMASRFEGMPLLALEALACGLPLVATRTGELGRILTEGNAGRLVDSPAPETLADALLEVLAHPDHYPRNACARAAEPFRSERVYKTLCETMNRERISP